MKSNCLLILEKFDDYCSRNHEMVNSMLDTFPSCIGCNDIIAIEEICKDSQVLNLQPITSNVNIFTYFIFCYLYSFRLFLVLFISCLSRRLWDQLEPAYASKWVENHITLALNHLWISISAMNANMARPRAHSLGESLKIPHTVSLKVLR